MQETCLAIVHDLWNQLKSEIDVGPFGLDHSLILGMLWAILRIVCRKHTFILFHDHWNQLRSEIDVGYFGLVVELHFRHAISSIPSWQVW